MNEDLEKMRRIMYYFSSAVLICVVFLALFLMYSCTISFQNIPTHGTATDLVDENQSASADVKADVQVLTIVMTLLGGIFYIHNDVREIRNDMKQKNARIDKLYEMFIDLIKKKNA